MSETAVFFYVLPTSARRVLVDWAGKLEEAASGAESGLLLGHSELPIPTEQVKRGIEFRVPEVVEGILDVWDGTDTFLDRALTRW